ncbi:MAG: DUF1800 domain-containing protein [Limisphaerales bacterium]
MLEAVSAATWDFEKAAHLLNRAGFGGAPSEIEKLVEMGPGKAVGSLVDYEEIPDATADPAWARPDPERAARLRAARMAGEEERREVRREYQQQERQRTVALRGWWLRRMACGPRPFQEKMVLFWHGHFATSVQKVRDAYLMWRQNELFRRLATGNWPELLVAVAKDPAMLLWLDQARSRKEHPNENFAREVMELFTLGEGHYTETDIAEGARALTGWSYAPPRQCFVERPAWHDRGEKVIFGRRGNFDGEDFLKLIAAQPQAARFITAKLWNFFAGAEPSPALGAALAARFRDGGENFKPLLRAMFLSGEFYAPSLLRNQVKSPAQWLAGSARVLERELPPPAVCSNLTRNLGQDLFAPPNVKGWDGGLSWITTNTLLARYNEAAVLVEGDVSGLAAAAQANRPDPKRPAGRRLQEVRVGGVDVEKLFAAQERSDKDLLVAAMERRLLQSNLKPGQEKVLRDYLAKEGEMDRRVIRNAIRLVMSTPEYQLC